MTCYRVQKKEKTAFRRKKTSQVSWAKSWRMSNIFIFSKKGRNWGAVPILKAGKSGAEKKNWNVLCLHARQRSHLQEVNGEWTFYYIFPLSCLKTFLKRLIEYLCIYHYEFPYVTISSMKPEETCLFSLPSFKNSEQDVKYL